MLSTSGATQVALSDAQWLLLIVIWWLSVGVAYAVGRWSTGSRSTPPKKQPPSPQVTPDSGTPSVLAALQRLEADQASLSSTLESVVTTTKRLSSRQGMRDLRARRAAAEQPAEPPTGASKADLYRYYGMAGKVGPEFAREQMRRERDQPQLDAFDTDNVRSN